MKKKLKKYDESPPVVHLSYCSPVSFTSLPILSKVSQIFSNLFSWFLRLFWTPRRSSLSIVWRVLISHIAVVALRTNSSRSCSAIWNLLIELTQVWTATLSKSAALFLTSEHFTFLTLQTLHVRRPSATTHSSPTFLHRSQALKLGQYCQFKTVDNSHLWGFFWDWLFACGSLDTADLVFAWGRSLARATGNDIPPGFGCLRHVSGDHADDCVFYLPF